MMKIFGFLAAAAIFFFTAEIQAQSGSPIVRLRDVKNIFVDEGSFKITFSSCGTNVGGMVLPCAKHSDERREFLIVLKRWLGKSGFTVVDDRADADGIVQGDMSLDDYANVPSINERIFKKKKDPHIIDKPEWHINAWIVNQNGYRFWTLREDYYPEISYKAAGKPKIEGKKLAKAIQYDFKRGK